MSVLACQNYLNHNCDVYLTNTYLGLENAVCGGGSGIGKTHISAKFCSRNMVNVSGCYPVFTHPTLPSFSLAMTLKSVAWVPMPKARSELRSRTFFVVSHLFIHDIWFSFSRTNNSLNPDYQPAYVSLQECHEGCQIPCWNPCILCSLMICQSIHDIQEGNKTDELIILSIIIY